MEEYCFEYYVSNGCDGGNSEVYVSLTEEEVNKIVSALKANPDKDPDDVFMEDCAEIYEKVADAVRENEDECLNEMLEYDGEDAYDYFGVDPTEEQKKDPDWHYIDELNWGISLPFKFVEMAEEEEEEE